MCVKCGDNTCNNPHCNALPKGLRGPRGYQGEKGEKGDKGNTGIAGPQGPQGVQGIPGIAGGLGLQGVQGPIGPQGATGAPGLPGANGINGSNGIDGAIGLTGPKGPAGDAGPQGERGEQGIPGNNAFKFVNEYLTSFDNTTITITRDELTLFQDVPDGYLAGTTVKSMSDFQIQIWSMVVDPTPSCVWTLVTPTYISEISVNDTTGEINIGLTGGSIECKVRVVILG